MQPEQGIDINDPTLVRTMPGFGSGSSSRVGDECGSGSNHLSSVGEVLTGQEGIAAAVGWCAPTDIVYDGEVIELENVFNGTAVNLPAAQMVRGGIVHRDPAPVVDRNGFRTETGF